MTGTLAEKILSRAAGKAVRAGDVVIANPDVVMIHDSIAPTAIRILEEDLGVDRVFDTERVAVAIDHVAPASTVGTAESQKRLRAWVGKQGIRSFFDAGRGIAHQVLVEERIARPGRLVVGSDSHSTAYGSVGAFGTGLGATDIALALATGQLWLRVPETILVRLTGSFRAGVRPKDVALWLAGTLRADGATYRAIEYQGTDTLSVSERMTLATMALEVGAKAGIVSPAGLPEGYGDASGLVADDDAVYERTIDVDLDALGPMVAVPPTVDAVQPLGDIGRVPVDVVYLGTCTNGREDDMRAAARLLSGRRVAAGVRMMVVPASSRALEAAVADGTVQTLLEAGVVIGPPGCGACIGRHMGVLAPGDVCLFTGNRNFRGRMGSPEASIYLGSPEVAAATAVAGYIADPRELEAVTA